MDQIDQLVAAVEQLMATATGKTTKAVKRVVLPDAPVERVQPRTIEDDIAEQDERAAEGKYTLDSPCANPNCTGVACEEGHPSDAGYCIPCRRERTKARARKQAVAKARKAAATPKDGRPEFPDRHDIDNGITQTADIKYGSTFDDGQEQWDDEITYVAIEDIRELAALFDKRSLSRGGDDEDSLLAIERNLS